MFLLRRFPSLASNLYIQKVLHAKNVEARNGPLSTANLFLQQSEVSINEQELFFLFILGGGVGPFTYM